MIESKSLVGVKKTACLCGEGVFLNKKNKEKKELRADKTARAAKKKSSTSFADARLCDDE